MVEAVNLLTLKKVDLKNLNVIMAFSGWPDAKRVATYAVEYLRDKLQMEKIGEIDPKPFYDFSIHRPYVSIQKGLMKEYALPVNEFYIWTKKSGDHDLLVFIGVEPNINWSGYVELVFQAFDLKQVHRICLLGGLVDSIPHTIDPLISGSATTRELIEEMKTIGVTPVDYNGPSSIHSLIMSECKRKKLPALSMWGHAPEYIDEVDPRTAHSLLNKTIALLGIEADLEELQMEGSLFKKRLDSLMERDNSFSQLVHSLEIDYKNTKRTPDYFT